MSSRSKNSRSIKSINYNIEDKNSIINNALKKRKSVKEYREKQEFLIKEKNRIFEQELQKQRQSQLNNISKTRKNKKSNNNEKGFFERIKSRFTQKSKSKSNHSKSNHSKSKHSKSNHSKSKSKHSKSKSKKQA